MSSLVCGSGSSLGSSNITAGVSSTSELPVVVWRIKIKDTVDMLL